MAGRTEVIEVAPGRVVIQTYGLRELSRALSDLPNKEIPKILATEMKAAGEPLAQIAKSHAQTFAKSGDFASSISISGGRSGIFLRSTDPGAGAIEFAKPDNRYAPDAGSPPRALFAAINEGLPGVEQQIGLVVEHMAQAVLDQDYTTPD